MRIQLGTFGALLFWCILILSGCACRDHTPATKQSRFPQGSLEDSTIADGERSAFGSMYARRLFLDKQISVSVPAEIVTRPGSLKGHWFQKDEESELIIEQYNPKNPDHAKVSTWGWESDNFIVYLKQGSEKRFMTCLHASYEVFAIYGVDVDGDGVDEIVIEHGRGRGTFVYLRQLTIAKCGPKRFLRIFEIDLNGYISGKPRDARPILDPDVWERRYAFIDKDSDGILEIYVYVIPPKCLSLYLARANNAMALQFPRMLYSYCPELCTYELADFEFRRLE